MPQQTIQDVIRQEAKAAGVPEAFALAVAEQESSFNPTAIGPEITEGSAKGQRAIGTFQIVPSTAAQRGFDPHDHLANIKGGVGYLRELLDQHQGDYEAALRTYGGVVRNTTYVPGVVAKMQKYQGAAPSQPATPKAAPGPTTAAVGGPPQPSFLSRAMSTIGETFDPRTESGRVNLGATAGAGALALATGGTSLIPTAVGAALGGGGAALANIRNRPTPPPVPEAAKEVATTAATQAAYDLGGGVVMKGLSKVLSPFAKKMTVEGYEAIRQMAGKVLPAQVTESRTLDIMQNIAEGSLLGGGKIKQFKDQQGEIVNRLVEATTSRYGKAQGLEDAGTAFVKGLERNTEAFHQAGGALYSQVDQLAQHVKVPTAQFRAFAEQELKRSADIPQSATTGTARELLSDFLDWSKDIVVNTPASTILNEFGQPARAASQQMIPREVSFANAQFLRSRLLQRIRGFTAEKDDVARGVAEQLVKQVDDAMESAAAQLSPQAEAAWRHADQFWKSGKEQFESKFLRRLAEKDPERIALTLMGSRSVTPIEAAKAAVSTKTWQKVQSAAAHEIVRKATNVQTGQLDGRLMLSNLKTMSPKTLRAIFPQTADEIQRLARTANTVQGQQGEGTGRVFIQLTQGGAALAAGASMFGGGPGLTAGSVGILLGPEILARVMTHPLGIRWLTTGLALGPRSVAGQRAIAQLNAALARGAFGEEGPPMPSTLTPSRAQGAGPGARGGAGVQPPPRPSF